MTRRSRAVDPLGVPVLPQSGAAGLWVVTAAVGMWVVGTSIGLARWVRRQDPIRLEWVRAELETSGRR